MTFSRFTTLALLALRAVSVLAAAEPEVEAKEKVKVSPNLAIKIKTTFPQSEVFGVKLVNGHPTQAVVALENDDVSPVTVQLIHASLWGPDPKTKGETDHIVRNLTSTRYNIEIPPGENESIAYSFATELHPQDLRLQITALLTSGEGGIYTLNAYNETVSIVEPDASYFDPQLIFLYLMLLGLFAGSVYFIYNTWIATLFPQNAKAGKGGERAKRSSGGSKPVDPSAQTAVTGADGPAVTSGTKYDQSWIPEHHLQRPEAKRTKSSGRPKSKGKAE